MSCVGIGNAAPLAVAAIADRVSAVFRSTIMLSATPESMRGRLTGIEFMQVASAPTYGNVEAGLVASLTSVRFSVVSGGLVCVAGTVVIGLALVSLGLVIGLRKVADGAQQTRRR